MAVGIAYGWQVENSSGTPVSGAKVFFKIKGTSTNATTYTDSALTVPAANPVQADAAGWFATYISPTVNYDIQIKSADESITYQSTSVSPSATGSQPVDATLTALAGLGLENRKLIRGTGGDTAENVFSGDLFEVNNARDFGATGDGVTIDTADWLLFQAAAATGVGYVPVGEYLIGQVGIPDGGFIFGAGSNVTSLVRQAAGNFLNAPTAQNVHVSGLTLDLKRSVNGWSGHGISSVASDSTFEHLRVLDFGSDLITGGGSGVLVVKPTSGAKPERVRLMNSNFVSDPTCDRSYGWIFSEVDFSFASNLYSRHAVGYAHELKDDSRFNVMIGLIGHDSNWCLAYGQETVGVDGCDMNVAVGVIAASCDGGYLVGEGFGNVLVGLVSSETDSPGREVTKNAIRYENGATQNITIGAVSLGAGVTQTVRHTDSDQNYTSVAAHDSATVLARFDGTSEGNFVDVLHPGPTNSILSRIVYGDVTTLRGATANVVHCQASGERVGTISGFFRDVVGTSTATHSSSHFWRYDSEQLAFHAFGIPGANGDEAGIVVNINGTSRQGQFSYAKATSGANDFWLLRVNATDVLRLFFIGRAATN